MDTGDPIPEDCDAVIMVEDIVKNDDGSITIHAAAAPWQHIRQIGEDICAGEMILPSFMEITPAAKDKIIREGYDPIYGARPLKRYLQSKVETLLARAIISEDIAPETTLVVDVKNEELCVTQRRS